MEDEFKELNFSNLEENKGNDWTWEKNYNFRDPVVSRVVNQFVERSNTGYEKYGQTLDAERRQGVKDLGGYLQDVQEELMDAILYIQAAKEELMDTPPCKCNVKDAKVASAIKWKEERKAKKETLQQHPLTPNECFYGCDSAKNGLPYYVTDVTT